MEGRLARSSFRELGGFSVKNLLISRNNGFYHPPYSTFTSKDGIPEVLKSSMQRDLSGLEGFQGFQGLEGSEGLEGLEDYEGRMDGTTSNTLELRELGGYIYIYI